MKLTPIALPAAHPIQLELTVGECGFFAHSWCQEQVAALTKSCIPAAPHLCQSGRPDRFETLPETGGAFAWKSGCRLAGRTWHVPVARCADLTLGTEPRLGTQKTSRQKQQ
jgi:hypothetical protein